MIWRSAGFLGYLKKDHPGYVIEGHCPSLLDLDLAKFLYLGINGDHTEHTLEEVKQRIENGMFFEIQDKNVETGNPGIYLPEPALRVLFLCNR